MPRQRGRDVITGLRQVSFLLGQGVFALLQTLRLTILGFLTLHQSPLKALYFGPLLADLGFRLPLESEGLIFGLNDSLTFPRLGLSLSVLSDPSGGLFGRSNTRLGDVPAQEISQEERNHSRHDCRNDRCG